METRVDCLRDVGHLGRTGLDRPHERVVCEVSVALRALVVDVAQHRRLQPDD